MNTIPSRPSVPEDTLLDAAADVFLRYGIARTTMADIAKAAGVSRQTLYGRFDNKNGIASATMAYVMDRAVAQVRADWRGQQTVGARLDTYFEHLIVHPYRLVQDSPDADDLLNGSDPRVRPAYKYATELKMAAMHDLLAPHAARCESAGQNIDRFARMVAAAAIGLKVSAESEEDLRALLDSLRTTVLAVLGEN